MAHKNGSVGSEVDGAKSDLCKEGDPNKSESNLGEEQGPDQTETNLGREQGPDNTETNLGREQGPDQSESNLGRERDLENTKSTLLPLSRKRQADYSTRSKRNAPHLLFFSKRMCTGNSLY